MAAAALSNYQMGDMLGRGASGQVYRALNFLTGETVAIKSISLQSLPVSSLPEIMSEIDLLKNLNHPNIVKYKGFARDKDNLFIVLEYCENGSLQTILKKFGKFPESLVAVYVSQVLEGLVYLHEQGVIHRDIKGANILTNKDGSVKLADFGVSARTATPTLEGTESDSDNEVVGSPYWMAPEVIEQSGASTASDVWSVGCVVVELLEGKPPYGDLAPMQALWRIVQDESMRIPDGASPIVKDFLYHCFQKDPNMRVSAKKLLRHPWMQSARKQIDTSTAPNAPRYHSDGDASRVNVEAQNYHKRQGITRQPSSIASNTSLPESQAATKRKNPITVYDEAVQRVQEWNDALNATPKSLDRLNRPQSASMTFQSTLSDHQRRRVRRPEDLSQLFSHQVPNDSSNGIGRRPVSALHQPSLEGGRTPHSIDSKRSQHALKGMHVNEVLSRSRENVEAEQWDNDFASDITLSNITSRPQDLLPEQLDQLTLRPSGNRLRSGLLPVTTSDTNSIEDYSDLAAENSDLEIKLAHMKLRFKGRQRLMHPKDLRKIKNLAETSVPQSLPVPIVSPPSVPTEALSQPTVRATAAILHSPPGFRTSSMPGRNGPTGSQIELQKYTEADDEDYSDVFFDSNIFLAKELRPNHLKLESKAALSQRDDQEDDMDPFAEIDDDFDADNLEANLLRDKRATLCSNINKLIDQLQVGTPTSILRSVCDELLSVFESAPNLGIESHFVAKHGMLAILEVLESRLSRDVAVRTLKIVNFIVAIDVENLESFCLVGGIPAIIPYTSKKHGLDTRIEASIFIQHLTQSALTLQMFISCRGLKILVELLDEDYTVNRTLILSSLEGIWSVFNLHSPTPKTDFCRMFVREGILDPLSTALLSLLNDPKVEEDIPKRAVEVLLLFSQVSQADGRIRDAFSTRTIMMRILKALETLPRKLLVTAVKAVKHLSTSPQLIEVLQNSNAMEVLVVLLSNTIKGSYSNEICSHIFQSIYSMCRLSKARQEEAAASGIIPLLKQVIINKYPVKQFALPILCDLANAGKVSRRLLWQNNGLAVYLNLLDDPYWRVSALEAILAWLQDETARVEDVLLEITATESLSRCFVNSSGVSFEGLLDPFLKIFRLSHSLASAVSSTTFFRRLSDALERQTKAVTKLNLLRITRVMCESHPDSATLVSRFSLANIVDKLAKQDEAVLVRELAKEIYPSLLFGSDIKAPEVDRDMKRVFTVMRRNASDSSGITREPHEIGVSAPLPQDVEQIVALKRNQKRKTYTEDLRLLKTTAAQHREQRMLETLRS